MKLSLLVLTYLSSLALADTAFVPSSSECLAVEKRSASTENNVAKRDTSLDHCGVTGYLRKRDSEGPSQNHVSLDHCANYCVCTLGKESCKSFEWTEDLNQKGVGHCRIHPMTLNKRNHRARLAKREDTAAPIFYNNECFHQVRRQLEVMTIHPPHPTSTSTTTTQTSTSKGSEATIKGSPDLPLGPGPVIDMDSAEPNELPKRAAKVIVKPTRSFKASLPLITDEPVIPTVIGTPVTSSLPDEPITSSLPDEPVTSSIPGIPIIVGEPVLPSPTDPLVVPTTTGSPISPEKRDASPEMENIVVAALLGV